MTDPTHSITLTRVVNAPVHTVYAAWMVPDPMSRWLGKVEADVRPGGRYRFESESGEGQTFVFTGEYLALEPGHRVVQSFLAGEADTPSPYPDEFVEIRLREISETQTELTFVNGWNGEAIGGTGPREHVTASPKRLPLRSRLLNEASGANHRISADHSIIGSRASSALGSELTAGVSSLRLRRRSSSSWRRGPSSARTAVWFSL